MPTASLITGQSIILGWYRYIDILYLFQRIVYSVLDNGSCVGRPMSEDVYMLGPCTSEIFSREHTFY